MGRRATWLAAFTLLVCSGLAPSSAVADSSPPAPSSSQQSATVDRLGSSWDSPHRWATVWDRHALTASVDVTTVKDSTADEACDVFVTTYTLRWTARNGHTITAVVTQGDDFSWGWTRLDTTSYAMTPEAEVLSTKAPETRRWVLRETQQPSSLCPRDSRMTNHVEIYVDGHGRGKDPATLIKPPSRKHLAAVWTYPTSVTVVRPARVEVSLVEYHEIESAEGPCEAHLTEIDVYAQALGDARIIAVGERRPGERMVFQRGDAELFGRGVVAHDYYLVGTTTRSPLCPPDGRTENRIEIYTDATR